MPSKFVVELVKGWDIWLKTLAFTDLEHELLNLAAFLRRLSGHCLPVVEDHLGERLSGRRLAQFPSEAKALVDRKVGLDGVHGCSWSLLLGEDVATLSVESRVDAAEGVLWALDFNHVHGLLQSGVGKKGGGVDDTSASGDELSSTTVDSIGVQGDVHNVVTGSTHDLLGTWSLLRSPLEGGDARILDFREELNSFRGVNKEVGSSAVWAEAPDLSGVSDIPSVLVRKHRARSLKSSRGPILPSSTALHTSSSTG